VQEHMYDIIYGLRNLSVMDDEQTRIEDMLEDVPEDVRLFVSELIDAGEYARAYRVAIIAWARGILTSEIEKAIPAWHKDFGSDSVTTKDITETLYELLY